MVSNVRSWQERSASFLTMMEQEAIVVRNAIKSYGRKTVILNGLNMTVPRGSIYGLLGASGCGKTTLLTCIVGVRQLSDGELWVLGGTPGSKGSGIPGPRVGYMPQEISLVGEFTVSDALCYFGTVNGLENDEIEDRKEYLSKLLQLPSDDRLVKNMSGGQQRRISFAAALIHNPELLILDEPTVGLDPILRENIWEHLIKLTREENVTIVITTHYIEEAKDADKIGLMRGGRLLAESSPQQLLQRFQCSSLEEAFLALSRAQDNVDLTDISTAQTSKEGDSESNILCQNQTEDTTVKRKASPQRPECKSSRSKRFKALMRKNSLQFLRHYSGLVFAFIFPIIQVSTFFIGVGGDPKDLSIGIINDEAGDCNHTKNFGSVWYDEQTITCHFSNLSCRFLHELGNSIVTQEHYSEISKAHDAILDGTLVGVIHFHRNMSEALERRIEDFIYAEDGDLVASQIQISLDTSDSQIGNYMKKKLFERLLAIFKDIIKDCRIPPKFIDVPLRINPMYGTMEFRYDDYMAPAYILTLSFFLATILSTMLILTERSEGVWDRSVVQGIKTWEILLAHILTQVTIIIIHTAMSLCICFFVWGLECKGSIFPVILFTFLSGVCGIMYGFSISILSVNQSMANYASAGSFLPLIILGGSLWPVQGMPKALRWFSLALPLTFPAMSLRDVFVKDFSLHQPEVFIGVLVLIGWILLLFIICILGLKKS